MGGKLNISKIDKQIPISIIITVALIIIGLLGKFTEQDPVLVSLALTSSTVFLAPLIIEILQLTEKISIKKNILIYSFYVLIAGTVLAIDSFGDMTYNCTIENASVWCKASKLGFFVLYIFVNFLIGCLKFESLKKQNNLIEENKKIEVIKKDNEILQEINNKLQKELDLERNTVDHITIDFLKLFKITINKKVSANDYSSKK